MTEPARLAAELDLLAVEAEVVALAQPTPPASTEDGSPQVAGEHRRPLHGHEKAARTDWTRMRQRLDGAQQAIAEALRTARADAITRLGQHLAAAPDPAAQMMMLATMPPTAITPPEAMTTLRNTLLRQLSTVARDALADVQAELLAQGVPLRRPDPARVPLALATAATWLAGVPASLTLTQARAAAPAVLGRRSLGSGHTSVRAADPPDPGQQRRQGPPPAVPLPTGHDTAPTYTDTAPADAPPIADPRTGATQLVLGLRDASDAQLDDAAGQAVNTAEGAGRGAGLAAVDAPGSWYASELLDSRTCTACSLVDGTEYGSYLDALGDYPNGQYDDCQGGPRCRGTLVFVAGTETGATMPGTEGDGGEP